MKASADVVIIGAGVIGCSTAYHLARAGITDVAIVEMESVGSGSSGKSASMLSLQFRPDELSVRMAQYSYAKYMQFEEEFGVPPDFKRTGWLSVATEAYAKELVKGAETLKSLGVRTDILEPQQVKALYPELNIKDIVVGTWGPDDGTLDPHMIMWGYCKRARQLGATLHEGVRATGIQVTRGRVEGIVTDKGVIATRTAVNAGGPWAIEIGEWVGIRIPILNLARSIVVTGPFPGIPPDRPFVEDVAAEWYCRPEGPGILMGMGKEPTENLDVQFKMETAVEMIEVATHRIPALAEADMLTGWTGVRPLTPDDRPILGPVDSVEGFLLNCGWGGVGIIQAPIAGQLVAEWVAHGSCSTMDGAPFGIERFGRDAAGSR